MEKNLTDNQIACVPNENEEHGLMNDETTTLLKSMQHVYAACKDSQMNTFSFMDDNLKYIMERMSLSSEEATLFSIICQKSVFSAVSLGNIAKHLDCNALLILQHRKTINQLMERGLVEVTREGKYFVPRNVLTALERNETYKEEVGAFATDEEFYTELFHRISQLCDNKISKVILYDIIQRMLENNASLRFAETLEKYRAALKEEEFLYLLSLSLLWLVKGRQWAGFSELCFVQRDANTINKLKSALLAGTSNLLTKGIIKPFTAESFEQNKGFTLTDDTKEALHPINESLECDPLGELMKMCEEEDRKEKASINLILPIRITKHSLFYNETTSRQVEELAMLLDENNMQNVLHRLKRSDLRCGFTCLFHGGPGTGKTETVLQLARRTGRAVHQVDYSQMRNRYVGDSEKRVKAEFDAYRSLLQKCDRAPILLLNEADALIGKRNENAERAVDKSENAIQNIILQEMETFDGILIATTNLACSLDKAFERRFLYKVEFETPNEETRTLIWRSMMPSLNLHEASELAERFPDFAGGQIENIYRKSTVSRVLHGRTTSWEELIEMCNQERLDSQPKSPIGFLRTNKNNTKENILFGYNV